MSLTKASYSMIEGAPINVLDYGAVGDGVADDKAAIDAAIAAASANQYVDLAGKTYSYVGAISSSSVAKLFNGRVNATNDDFELKSIGLGSLCKTGDMIAPNLFDNTYFNVAHTSLAASNILGGSKTEPQRIGKQLHVQYFIGDGVTDTFSVTAPFTISDLSPARTVQAAGIRMSDGVPLLYTVDNISGYGTATISARVRFGGVAPPNGAFIAVSVRSSLDDGSADPTLIATAGYNNIVNPIMSAAYGAHGIIGNGGGHNVILGGSYGNIFGSYSGTAGQATWVGRRDPSGTVGTFAFGRGLQVDGLSTFVAGIGCDLNSDYSFAAGDRHKSVVDVVALTGRLALGQSIGERVHGGGKVTDADAGLYQVRELILGGNTTDATLTNLTNTNNGSTQVVPAKSSAVLRVEVAAVKDDYTKMQAFQGDFLLTEDNAGNCLVNGAATDQALSSISSIGAPGYAAAARGSGSGLLIRVTGAVGENVRWVAYCRIVQTRYT